MLKQPPKQWNVNQKNGENISLRRPEKQLLDRGFDLLKRKKPAEALAVFRQLPSKCKKVLLGLARGYQGMGQYDNALNSFKQIPNWSEDKQVLLGLARGYQERELYR